MLDSREWVKYGGNWGSLGSVTLVMRTVFCLTICFCSLACKSNAQPCISRRVPGGHFSSFVGGFAQDSIRDVATGPDGSIYLVGGTASASFPVTPGTFDTTLNTGGLKTHDVFVMKLNRDGTLVWSTYLGGIEYDRAYAVEVDNQGFVYVAGRAGPGFVVTPGVFQETFAGDVMPNLKYGPQDGFVTKLSPDGASVIWSTYFGTDGPAFIRDIDVDTTGHVYLALMAVKRPIGSITPGAFQENLAGGRDAVIAKLASDGSSVIWSTYLGGSGDDVDTPSIRVNDAGQAYVLGYTNSLDIPTTNGAYQTTYGGGGGDLYVAKLSADGKSLIYGTYLGGSDVEFTETHGLALDATGRAIIAASTLSSDYPVTQGAYQQIFAGLGGSSSGFNTNYPGDGFVSIISTNGSQLLASTFLGGSGGDGIEGVSVDTWGSVYVSGATFSVDFPATPDAFQGMYSGHGDFFAAKFSADLSTLVYATYLGGSGKDFGRASSIDSAGDFFIAGTTLSTDWPTVNALQPNLMASLDGAVGFISVGQRGAGGDFDVDGDVDLCDSMLFMDCLSGADPLGCSSADIDGNGTASSSDFASLVNTISGPQ